MMNRSSGLLLHVSSLPDRYGIGTFGKNARRWIDFLAKSGQQWWQLLPLGATGYGNSPYQCYSAYAGNPAFIDLEELLAQKLLNPEDLGEVPVFSDDKVEYDRVTEYKEQMLLIAFRNFQEFFDPFKENYYQFLAEHSWWLDDYALFRALKEQYNGAIWNEWPSELRMRNEHALQIARHQYSKSIHFHRFCQFLFFCQWKALRKYAEEKRVRIIGDLPLYVSLDSSDVWANQDIFLLDEKGKPEWVGGVPPDYFSTTGQLWGNPVFNWSRLKERNYDWWIARVHFNLRMFDRVRIDHFRGLESFWAVPASETTAINGQWLPANGAELLSILKSQLGTLLIIAEDLGVITPEVEKLRDDFHLPGMKVLQFAFSSDEKNGHLPFHLVPNSIIYTGTHDNDTSVGWRKKASRREVQLLNQYLPWSAFRFSRRFIQMAWSSVAVCAIVPLQDLLALGSSARMNTPGVACGNWEWRFRWSMLKRRHAIFLQRMTRRYNRLGR